MWMEYNRKLILEDGTEYFGFAFGDVCEKVCEIVFNTSMVGYQEILSDPSYTYQAVVMTYPLIGNYGMCAEDYEANTPTIGGLIVREYNDLPSNFRSVESLGSVMKRYGIPGVSGVDTRKLTRSIRELGCQKVLFTGVETSKEEGLALLAKTGIPKDAVSKVSSPAKWEAGGPNARFHVALVDCGVKHNIVRSLAAKGCRVTVVPWNTPAEEILGLNPSGVCISNGPGDPVDVWPVVETAKALRGKVPLFGICLGHQILSLAYGGRTYKLKFGHRGGNHPVKNLKTGKIEITSQNHSYAVDADSLGKTDLSVTHINLLDQTVEGAECEAEKVFSVQYHPESAPGPQDSTYLFDRFLVWMEEAYAEKNGY